MKRLRQRLPKEDNIRLHEPVARLRDAPRYLLRHDHLLHPLIGVRHLTLDASLRGEAAVRFNDDIIWYTGLAFQTVDVLREEPEELALLVQERDKGMRDCRPVPARIQFVCEGVEGERVLAKIGNVEDGFGVGKVEARKVGVEACVWGAEVGNAC